MDRKIASGNTPLLEEKRLSSPQEERKVLSVVVNGNMVLNADTTAGIAG